MSKAAELANLIGNINAGGGGANKNVIINGAMNIAQRGTSSTGLGASSGYFVCDRWRFSKGGDASAGRFTMTQDSSAPEGFANSMKLACTTTDTSIAADEFLFIGQRIEGQNMQTFAKGTSSAKPFAVSFYVKGNASATYVCELADQDNGRQISKTFNVTTDWTRVELNFPADTTGALDDDNAKSFELFFILHAGSNYTSGTVNSSSWASSTDANRVGSGTTSFFDSTDRTFFLTGVQLEVGQNPTEFEHKSFAEELALCQRYYTRYTGDGTNFGPSFQGTYNSTTIIVAVHRHTVPMRAGATFGFSQLSDFDIEPFDAQPSAMSTFSHASTDHHAVQITDPSARTQGFAGVICCDVNGGFYEFDAEL